MISNLITDRRSMFKFITPYDVKLVTGLPSSIEDDKLITPIINASLLRLEPILGKTLYAQFKEQFIIANYDPTMLPDGSTLPDNINYKELYQEMYHMLCWWSYIESLIDISLKTSNKGIMYNNSDYADNSGKEGYNQLNNRQKMIAESHTDRFIDYIKNTFKLNKDVVKESVPSGRKYFATIYDNARTFGDCW